MSMRFKLPPGGDVPATTAARRLGLELEEFKLKLIDLMRRGFPGPDPTTGNYDLDAIDVWRKGRHKHLFPEASNRLTPATARDAKDVVRARLAGGQSG